MNLPGSFFLLSLYCISVSQSLRAWVRIPADSNFLETCLRSSNFTRRERWFSPGTPASFTRRNSLAITSVPWAYGSAFKKTTKTFFFLSQRHEWTVSSGGWHWGLETGDFQVANSELSWLRQWSVHCGHWFRLLGQAVHFVHINDTARVLVVRFWIFL